MKTKITKPLDKVDTKKSEAGPKSDEQSGKAPIKKRKHVSALVAASMGRSAVSQTQANAYDDAGYPYTGTNDTYKEE
ncbi:MAG: hypothetical protein ACTHJN_14895 [Ginsengibacter sp.]